MKELFLPSTLLRSLILLVVFGQAAKAEVPLDPPGTYSSSWMGNTYMDAKGHKNVTEELADMCVSPNGRLFTAGYAETWGGGAEYNANDGGFIARYDRFESGFGDPVKAVAADTNYVFWGTPGKGFLRSGHGGGSAGAYTSFLRGKIITGLFAKDGKMMRIVLRGSDRTITGNEVLLSSDFAIQQATMRLVLADLTLSPARSSFWQQSLSSSGGKATDPNVVEALRRWNAGARVSNAHWFEARGESNKRRVVHRGTDTPADAAHIRLNCDLPYPEVNVRYFMADMALGGSRDFYWRTAEIAHEMGCLEAVLRHDAGMKVTNLDQFERKKVDGKVLITHKGSNERISGMLVKLSTDL